MLAVVYTCVASFNGDIAGVCLTGAASGRVGFGERPAFASIWADSGTRTCGSCTVRTISIPAERTAAAFASLPVIVSIVRYTGEVATA